MERQVTISRQENQALQSQNQQKQQTINEQQSQITQLHQQVQNLHELSALALSNSSYNFNQLKQEISRLKYQELAPQVRNENIKLNQLISEAKNKVGENLAFIVDLLLETQGQVEKTSESSQRERLNGKIEAYQTTLENSLTKEKLQTLLNKQKEFRQLEENLTRLQINEQMIQVPPKK